MPRTRLVLGFLAGVICIAVGAAHSLLGWKELTAAFSKTDAPADLVQGLAIPFQFTGVAMIAFGCITLSSFTSALRGHAVSLLPARIIALAYIAFGVWALAVIAQDAFLGAIFLVPGLMLLAGAWSDSPKLP